MGIIIISQTQLIQKVSTVYSENVLKSRIQNNSFYTDFSNTDIHTNIRTHCLSHYPADRDSDLVLETYSPRSLPNL